MSETAEKFTHLPPAAGRLGAVFARPKALAAICCVALAGLGWFALGVIFADMSALETFCRPLAEPVAWNASGLAVIAPTGRRRRALSFAWASNRGGTASAVAGR